MEGWTVETLLRAGSIWDSCDFGMISGTATGNRGVAPSGRGVSGTGISPYLRRVIDDNSHSNPTDRETLGCRGLIQVRRRSSKTCTSAYGRRRLTWLLCWSEG